MRIENVKIAHLAAKWQNVGMDMIVIDEDIAIHRQAASEANKRGSTAEASLYRKRARNATEDRAYHVLRRDGFAGDLAFLLVHGA